MKGAKPYENPLIPHARMRALFRALVEVRALSERLGSRGLPLGAEACWVAPVIDLREGDFVSAEHGGALAQHVRQIGLRDGAKPPRLRDLRAVLTDDEPAFHGTPRDRLLCAVGAAMAVKRLGREDAVVAFAGRDELKAPEWQAVFAAAASGDLPLVLVVLPERTTRTGRRLDLERIADRLLPVIPTDAADTIALYRVAQESLVRARAGGGAAVIDCTVVEDRDPVEVLGRQLVQRRVVPARWPGQVQTQVTALARRLQGSAE